MKKAQLIQVFELIEFEGPKLGLLINQIKTKIWSPNPNADMIGIPNNYTQVASTGGVKVLGSPVGKTPEQIAAVLLPIIGKS